jgi:hypothetical protein
MSTPNFEHPHLLSEKQLLQLLSAKTLQSLKPFHEFYDAIFLAALQLLESKRGSGEIMIPTARPDCLDEFMFGLYAIAIEVLRLREQDSSIRESQPKMREDRRVLTEERDRLKRLSQELVTSTRRLSGCTTHMAPAIRLHQEIQRLEKKWKRLEALEERTAMAIDPTLRDDYEAELCQTSRYHAKVTRFTFSLRKNSADLRRKTIRLVEHELLTLGKSLGVRIKTTRINTFASVFFGVALGETITDENVKTLRLRMRRKPKSPVQS